MGDRETALCAVYVRLSKEDEDKREPESESVQNQKALLVQYAVERGWDIYQIYCDEDYSGADALRPDFNRMLNDARAGRFQIVLCKSQSRFTRDMELVEKVIHGLFPLWGVRFIAVADNADTEVRGNKKARQINGLVNEWYLEDLSENVRMVLDMKRREGRYIGGAPLYGYQKDPADKNKLLIDPEAAQVVRQIFQWSLEGRGKQEIAHRLNDLEVVNPARYKAERGWSAPRKGSSLWSKTTVWRILRNEMYTGVMVQGRSKKAGYKSKRVLSVPKSQWFRVEGTHEAIVDRATFDAVQRGLDLRAKSDGRGERHVLAGLVYCAHCGSSMSRVTAPRPGGERVSYLRCRLYADSGREKRCTRHGIRLDALTNLVAERIRYYVQTYFDPNTLDIQPRQDARRAGLERERSHLAAQLAKGDAALKSLYLDKVAGVVTTEQFCTLNQSFLEEKSCLEGRLAGLDRELDEMVKPESREETLARVRELLKLDPLPRELVTLLVERIEVGERDRETGRQEVKITWKL